jgi:hypothetical protein
MRFASVDLAAARNRPRMEHVVDRGIQVLIPPDAKRRKGTRRGWDGGLYAFMRRALATERGGDLYRQRQTIIEPVFANTKHLEDRYRRRTACFARTPGAACEPAGSTGAAGLSTGPPFDGRSCTGRRSSRSLTVTVNPPFDARA